MESEVRRLINQPRFHRLLRQQRGSFHQVCSSLDVIGDATIAIESYLSGDISANDDQYDLGTTYLLVYGVLQALFIQQYAVEHLYEALGIPFDLKKYPGLVRVRDDRNASVGHPTKKDRPKPMSFHFIARNALSRAAFRLLSSDTESTGLESRWVNIVKLINDQRDEIRQLLQEAASELRRRERAHREAYRMKNLVDVFGTDLDYVLEKLEEGTRDPKIRAYGTYPVERVRKAMDDYRAALDERGIELDTYQGIEYLYEVLAYPVAQLEQFWRSEDSDIASTEMAEIVTYFVRKHILRLKRSAATLDAEYAETLDEA